MDEKKMEELNDDQLKASSGGAGNVVILEKKCPNCGGTARLTKDVTFKCTCGWQGTVSISDLLYRGRIVQ